MKEKHLNNQAQDDQNQKGSFADNTANESNQSQHDNKDGHADTYSDEYDSYSPWG